MLRPNKRSQIRTIFNLINQNSMKQFCLILDSSIAPFLIESHLFRLNFLLNNAPQPISRTVECSPSKFAEYSFLPLPYDCAHHESWTRAICFQSSTSTPSDPVDWHITSASLSTVVAIVGVVHFRKRSRLTERMGRDNGVAGQLLLHPFALRGE